jgi:hypothetical protein
MMKTKAEILQRYIEYMTEEQAETLLDVVRMFGNKFITKGDMMKFALSEEENNKTDSAIPVDYVRAIQEIHPNFSTMHHAYSYANGHGEMINVSEKLIEKLIEKFNSN